MQTAQEACTLLETFPNAVLSPAQTEQLNGKRASLLDTVARIIDRQQAIIEANAQANELRKKKRDRREVSVRDWNRTTLDPVTSLPDRAAFDVNLTSLISEANETELESGLLLVRVDKFDQLAARFGKSGSSQFLKTISALVCRAIRDQDLVCQLAADTLAVLTPDVDHEAGQRLAESIRNTVRHHHFHVDDTGTEVLVTASFGLTFVRAGDNSELALSRAAEALSKSQRQGRNQLHVFDGSQLVHCLAG
jgi:diguanylate cyclase